MPGKTRVDANYPQQKYDLIEGVFRAWGSDGSSDLAIRKEGQSCLKRHLDGWKLGQETEWCVANFRKTLLEVAILGHVCVGKKEFTNAYDGTFGIRLLREIRKFLLLTP